MIFYSRAFQAEAECKNTSRHLCTLEEMMKVWEEVSLMKIFSVLIEQAQYRVQKPL